MTPQPAPEVVSLATPSPTPEPVIEATPAPLPPPVVILSTPTPVPLEASVKSPETNLNLNIEKLPAPMITESNAESNAETELAPETASGTDASQDPQLSSRSSVASPMVESASAPIRKRFYTRASYLDAKYQDVSPELKDGATSIGLALGFGVLES
ncbi:MAG: hypothetical protein V4692_12650, partial [Bdellovibrionota bacterium]